VLDAAIGIGTQALGLRLRGFEVIGSDLSPGAVRRAAHEATLRSLRLPCLVADFRALALRSASADVVLVADNALPHLQSEGEILTALAECFRCARPGGGCIVTMRDYGTPPTEGTIEIKPYGERSWNGRRYTVRQVWTWRGVRYDVALEIAPIGSAIDEQPTIVTTSYLAIPPARVSDLMREVGFSAVERIDGRFFQPVLVGNRS
jgi:SAM-dependent methyltransferase